MKLYRNPLAVPVLVIILAALLAGCENPAGGSGGPGGNTLIPGDDSEDGPGDGTGGSTEGQVSLTLDYNGATVLNGPATLSVASDLPVTSAILPQPQREGLQFYAWFNRDNLSYVDAEGFSLPEYPVILQAHWMALVGFVTNGGSAVANLELILADGDDTLPVSSRVLTVPGAPYRAGYTFTGWYLDEELTQLVESSTLDVGSSLNLYAGWNITSMVDQDYGHDIQFVNWLFDPPTLQVFYRKPETHAIAWELPGLTPGEHYSIDDTQPLISRYGLDWQVSRILIASRDLLPSSDHYGQTGTYNANIYFRILSGDGATALQVSRLLDIPPNRGPSISWFGGTSFSRSTPSSLQLSVQVWDYETRPEDLILTIHSSHSNAQFFEDGIFKNTVTLDHTEHVSLYGVPVQVSSRNLILALSGSSSSGPITTTLTLTLTDADGAQREESRTITIN